MFTRINTKSSNFLVLLSATLLGLSRVNSYLFFLVFFAFIPLLFYLSKRETNVFKSAVFFSVIFNVIYIHWISLVTFWGVIGIIIVFSIYFFFVFFLTQKISSYYNYKIIFPFVFLFVWLSLEVFINHTEFRFPWLNIGYALVDHPLLLQIADIGGIFLVSGMILLINIFLFLMIKSFSFSKVIWFLVLITVWILYGFYSQNMFNQKRTNLKIAIAQPNIPISKKHKPNFLDSTFLIIKKQVEQAKQKNANLVILPESVIPKYILKDRTIYNRIKNISQENEIELFLGFIDFETVDSRILYFNSAKKISAKADDPTIYKKNILVPLGERVPLLDYFPFLWNLKLGQANWEYGKQTTKHSIKNWEYSPLICFEIAFPHQTIKMTKMGIDFIVNITNDAWFGKSIGTKQHAKMAILRAIETRKPIFRSANTGYSVVVSPMGEILKIIDLFTQDILVENLILTDKKSLYLTYFNQYVFIFPTVIIILFIIGFIKKWKNNIIQ